MHSYSGVQRLKHLFTGIARTEDSNGEGIVVGLEMPLVISLIDPFEYLLREYFLELNDPYF